MADESIPQSEKPQAQVVWLAVAAMICLLLLALAALGMVFLLGHNAGSTPTTAPSITITNASNNQAEPVASGQPTPVTRPATSGLPPASRLTEALSGVPNQLPGASPAGSQHINHDNESLVRADTQSPPFYTTLSPVAKVQFRIREMPAGPENMKGPIPFRVHEYQAGSDGRVASVTAQQPEAGQEENFSYLPDVELKASKVASKGLSVEVDRPRKTSMVNGLRAPKDFQFLVAELRVRNLSKASLSLDPDAFEVRDTEDVRYLANPELLSATFPQQPMPGGSQASFEIAFLVPADASLTALATMEPGGGALLSKLNSN